MTRTSGSYCAIDLNECQLRKPRNEPLAESRWTLPFFEPEAAALLALASHLSR
jgi:hypothetical protein